MTKKFSIVITLDGATDGDAASVFNDVACLDVHSGVSGDCVIERVCVDGDVLADREELLALSRDVLVEAGELDPVDGTEGYPREGEYVCRRCNGRNMCDGRWVAPSPLWNAVMRGGSINGEWKYNEIICPLCFVELAEERGIATGWRLTATEINVELETATPSGRVWNEDSWLWEVPTADESVSS